MNIPTLYTIDKKSYMVFKLLNDMVIINGYEMLSKDVNITDMCAAINNNNKQISQLFLTIIETTESLNLIHLMTQALENCETNIYLHFSACNTCDKEIKYLNKILETNKKITLLNLKYDMTDEQINYLSNTLKINKTIKYLYLDFENISNEGIKHFFGALKNNDVVKYLNLSNNKIDGKVIKYLSNMLKINKKIKNVILNWNNLDHSKLKNQDMKYLSDMLKINKILKILSIFNNSFNYDNAKYLIDSLEFNNTLTKLKHHYASSYDSIPNINAKYLKNILCKNIIIKNNIYN